MFASAADRSCRRIQASVRSSFPADTTNNVRFVFVVLLHTRVFSSKLVPPDPYPEIDPYGKYVTFTERFTRTTSPRANSAYSLPTRGPSRVKIVFIGLRENASSPVTSVSRNVRCPRKSCSARTNNNDNPQLIVIVSSPANECGCTFLTVRIH